MKKVFTLICVLTIALMAIPFANAQARTGGGGSSSAAGSGYRGQSLNGSTGLFSIPSGRIGWEGGNVGIDIGYRAIINTDSNYGTTHIPALTLSLFNFVEVSAAFDIQPDFPGYGDHRENDDFLLGLKIRIPTPQNTAIAVGGNFQFLNIENDVYDYSAIQPYIAVTYRGNFFSAPAETTIVFGKTFYTGSNRNNNSNLDFGMGFDLILFPDVFGNTVHFIIDFANFSYSDNAWPHNSRSGTTNAVWRGILNAGFRLDLSTIPSLSNFKFLVDLIFNDLFDDGHRSFTIGVVFGFQP